MPCCDLCNRSVAGLTVPLCRQSARMAELADMHGAAAAAAQPSSEPEWDVQHGIQWGHKQHADPGGQARGQQTDAKPKSRFDWDSLIAALRKCAPGSCAQVLLQLYQESAVCPSSL